MCVSFWEAGAVLFILGNALGSAIEARSLVQVGGELLGTNAELEARITGNPCLSLLAVSFPTIELEVDVVSANDFFLVVLVHR